MGLHSVNNFRIFSGNKLVLAVYIISAVGKSVVPVYVLLSRCVIQRGQQLLTVALIEREVSEM